MWPGFHRELKKAQECFFKFKGGVKELGYGSTFVIDVPKGTGLPYNKLVCFVAPIKGELMY